MKLCTEKASDIYVATSDDKQPKLIYKLINFFLVFLRGKQERARKRDTRDS